MHSCPSAAALCQRCPLLWCPEFCATCFGAPCFAAVVLTPGSISLLPSVRTLTSRDPTTSRAALGEVPLGLPPRLLLLLLLLLLVVLLLLLLLLLLLSPSGCPPCTPSSCIPLPWAMRSLCRPLCTESCPPASPFPATVPAVAPPSLPLPLESLESGLSPPPAVALPVLC